MGARGGAAAACGRDGGSGAKGGTLGSADGEEPPEEKGGAASGCRGGGADTPSEGGRGGLGGFGNGREGTGLGEGPSSASGSATSSTSSIAVMPSGFFSGGRGGGRRLPAFDGGFGAVERALGAAGLKLLARGVLVGSDVGCDRRGGGGGLLTTGPCEGLEIGGPCEGLETGAPCVGLDPASAGVSAPEGLSATPELSLPADGGGLEGRTEAEGATERLPAGRGGLGLF